MRCGRQNAGAGEGKVWKVLSALGVGNSAAHAGSVLHVSRECHRGTRMLGVVKRKPPVQARVCYHNAQRR